MCLNAFLYEQVELERESIRENVKSRLDVHHFDFVAQIILLSAKFLLLIAKYQRLQVMPKLDVVENLNEEAGVQAAWIYEKGRGLLELMIYVGVIHLVPMVIGRQYVRNQPLVIRNGRVLLLTCQRLFFNRLHLVYICPHFHDELFKYGLIPQNKIQS